MIFKTRNIFILILILTVSCNKTLTYEIGTVKERMGAFKNPYSNSINKQSGYLTMRDSCQIHYFVDGEGEAIIVIHGGPGEPYKKPWEGLRLINQNYSFVYYDQRGCGKSTRCIDKFTSNKWNVCQTELYKKLGIETSLQDIEEIRKIIGVDKITLIGHSYGGVIAALYAIEFPENIKKLILVSPAPTIRYPLSDEFDYSKMIEKELPINIREEYQQYEKHLWDFNTIVKKTEEELSLQNKHFFYFYDEYHRNVSLSKSVSLIDNLVDKENIGGWLPYAYAWSFPSKFDYRKNLRYIKVPTLIVWGGKDLCQESWVKEYSEYIPHSKAIKINDCSHFLFEDNPNEFSEIVLNFLNDK
jgi:proline iminopeptidase